MIRSIRSILSTLSTAGVARLLPDRPRWVEVRGMPLAERARLPGPVRAGPPGFAALRADGDLAAAPGRPRGLRPPRRQSTMLIRQPMFGCSAHW